MKDIEPLLRNCDISGYLLRIETKNDWVSFRSSDHPFQSASRAEARFNRDGQVAFYLASGIETAKLNVPEWEKKVTCAVASQTINCFDLPKFAKDHGIFEDYLKSKKEGGYPLPQQTADILLTNGVTGILYSSYPDYLAGNTGCCIVIRPQDGGLVGETFFVATQMPNKIDPPEPPLPVSGSSASVNQTLESLPAPASGGGR